MREFRRVEIKWRDEDEWCSRLVSIGYHFSEVADDDDVFFYFKSSQDYVACLLYGEDEFEMREIIHA